MARFDEVELEPVILEEEETPATGLSHASRFRRLIALLTDLSLFVALSLALSPLLPNSRNWLAIAGIAGFVTVVSYYYFVGTWLLWGKTIGGTIFDVKVIAAGNDAMALKRTTLRWLGVFLSLITGGIGFALALLPSRLSLPDRISGTRCVSAV
ncbi:MAG: RDD family protein [Acidobacteriota bacterium]|nr:RDD family protein [Acidobacteriota bacterium]